MDEGRSENIGGMILMRRNGSSRRETSASTSLFVHKSHMEWLGTEPGFCVERVGE
jgi:hypothetical protein